MSGLPTEDDAALLDATGLLCPLPVLRAKKALRAVPPGGVLRVLATDPAAPRDFVAFAGAVGAEILSSTAEDGRFVIRLRAPA